MSDNTSGRTREWSCPSCGTVWLERPTDPDVNGCPECGTYVPFTDEGRHINEEALGAAAALGFAMVFGTACLAVIFMVLVTR